MSFVKSSPLSKISTVALITAFSALSAFAAKAKAPTTVVKFDPGASIVKWEAKKVTGQHHGQIKIKDGMLEMTGKNLKGGEFTIDMASITDEDLTDAGYNKKLTSDLKSDKFFDVEKFPTSVLKIKSAKSVNGFTGPTYVITADLTIKGKTNEVKFPAMIKTKDGQTTATANITVDRTKWGITYKSGKFFPNLGDKMIYDDFKLDVALASTATPASAKTN